MELSLALVVGKGLEVGKLFLFVSAGLAL